MTGFRKMVEARLNDIEREARDEKVRREFLKNIEPPRPPVRSPGGRMPMPREVFPPVRRNPQPAPEPPSVEKHIEFADWYLRRASNLLMDLEDRKLNESLASDHIEMAWLKKNLKDDATAPKPVPE